MLPRLPIALAQVKAVNTFENLLSEIRESIYSLYQAKEITKNIHNNIMNSIKLWNSGYYIYEFWKQKNIGSPHRLLLNLLEKINLKRSDKQVALSIFFKHLLYIEKYEKVIQKY